MHNDQTPDSIPVAQLVPPNNYPPPQPPAQPKAGGCLIAAIVTVLLFVAVMVGVGFLAYNIAKRQPANLTPQPWNTAQAPNGTVTSQFNDFRKAKQFFEAGPNPTQINPKFAEFADSLQSACDDAPNASIQSLINYDRYAQQVAQYTTSIGDPLIFRQNVIDGMKDILAGPIPFSGHSIIHVNQIGRNDYQIYATALSDYGHIEPVIWWVTESDGELKLYDWLHLELGIRNSHETGTLYVAQSNGLLGSYERYRKLSDEYLSLPDESVTREQDMIRILDSFERVRLPRQIDPSAKFITAMRWHSEGELERALALTKQIPGNLAPGRFRLSGDIYLAMDDYGAAIREYRSFHAQVGRNPESLAGLILCYEQLGQTGNEFKAHLDYIELTGAAFQQDITRVLAISNQFDSNLVFEAIDRFPDAENVFSNVIFAFGDNSFSSQRLEWLTSYLKISGNHPRALKYAEYQKQIIDGELSEIANCLNELAPEIDADFRDSIWTDLANMGKVAEIFNATNRSAIDFENIRVIYNDYYTNMDADEFETVCDLMIKGNPDHHLGHLEKGKLLTAEEQYESAVKVLDEAQSAIDESTDEYDLNDLNWEMLYARYHAGQREGLVDFAVDNQLVDTLIQTKIGEEEFDGILELVELSEVPENYDDLKCRMKWAQGEKEEALAMLSDRLKQEDSEYLTQSTRLLIDWCKELGTPDRAFEVSSTPIVFETLFNDAVSDKDWNRCDELLKMAKGKLPTEASFNHEINLHWSKGDYAAILNTISSVDDFAETANNQSLSFIVRTMIRTGQPELATNFANLALNRHDDATPKTVLLIKSKDYQAAAQLIEKHMEYSDDFFITDPDLSSKERRAFQNSSTSKPARINSYVQTPTDSFTILSKSTFKIIPDRLHKMFAKLNPGVNLNEGLPLGRAALSNAAYHLNNQCFIRMGDFFVTITQSDQQNGRWECDPSHPALQKLFDQATHSLAIETNWTGHSQEDKSYELAMRLAESFCDSNCLVVEDGKWKTLEAFRNDYQERLDTSNFSKKSTSEYIWGFRKQEPKSLEQEYSFNRKFAKAFERYTGFENDTAELTVNVAVEFGEAEELLAVRVTTASLGRQFEASFIGELLQESRVMPHLGKGSRVRFTNDDVKGFKLTINGTSTEASLNQ